MSAGTVKCSWDPYPPVVSVPMLPVRVISHDALVGNAAGLTPVFVKNVHAVCVDASGSAPCEDCKSKVVEAMATVKVGSSTQPLQGVVAQPTE